MTDLEKFVELYTSVGILLTPEKNSGGFSLVLEAKSQPGICGYTCFWTVLDFDENGKFISQGIWE